MGTAYALKHFKETYYWDWATRAARLTVYDFKTDHFSL